MFGYKKFRKLQDGIIEAILKIEESLLNKIVEVDLRLSKRMNNIDCLDEQETEEIYGPQSISEIKSETIAIVMEKIRSVIDNERNKRKELEIKLSCLTGYMSLLEDRLSEYKEKQKLIIDYLKVEQKTTPEKTELVKKKQ